MVARVYRKVFSGIIVLILLVTVGQFPNAYAGIGDVVVEPVIVEFLDPNLKAAIRTAVGTPLATVTPNEVRAIEHLDISNLGITDLTGLEYATGLISLDMSYNSVASIEPLKNSVLLQTLVMTDNEISDLSILENFTQLRDLDVSSNHIYDLSPVKSYQIQSLKLNRNYVHELNLTYPSLTRLEANYNDLYKLSNDQMPQNLRVVDLSNNHLYDDTTFGDFSLSSGAIFYIENNYLDVASSTVIEGFKAGGVNVYDEQRAYEDVSVGSRTLFDAVVDELSLSPETLILTNYDFIKLDRLSIYANGSIDLSGIEYAKNLKRLRLSGIENTDLSPISSLRQVEKLFLQENENFSDLSPIVSFTQLNEVNLSETNVSNLSPLVHSKNLRTLNIRKTKVTDGQDLAKMERLNYLNMSYTALNDLSFLTNVKGLSTLYAWGCHITDITPLQAMDSISRLSLPNNDLTDISPIANINVVDINVASNYLRDISPVANHPTIEGISFDHNNIMDISMLDTIPSLDFVNMGYNYIDLTDGTTSDILTYLENNLITVSGKDYQKNFDTNGDGYVRFDDLPVIIDKYGYDYETGGRNELDFISDNRGDGLDLFEFMKHME